MSAKSKLLVLSLLMLFLVASVSAVEMTRTHTFEKAEEKSYNFLGDDYTIRVTHMIPAGNGEVEMRINDHKDVLKGHVPIVWNDMKITIEEITAYDVTLKMVWSQEDSEPDFSEYIPTNARKSFEKNGKTFTVTLKMTDPVNYKVLFDVDGEEVWLEEKGKATLSNGNVIKAEDFVGFDSISKVKIALWVEKGTGEEVTVVTFDAEERVSENQQVIIDSEGADVKVKVTRIEEGGVFILVNDEEAILTDGATETLNSGIMIKVSKIVDRNPKSALISLNVPDEMKGMKYEKVDKTINLNQKVKFEAEGKEVTASFIGLNKDMAILELNGQSVTLEEGDEADSEGVIMFLKRINPDSYPARVQVTFSIPEKPKPVPVVEVPEIEEKEDTVDEADEVMEDTEETEEVEEVMEEMEPLAEQEIPVPETTTEEKEMTKQDPMIVKNFKAIINFFKWLF